MEIKEKYLPIGSVVLLKGGKKRAMIIGFCPIIKTGESFDYSGCLFPEGVMSSDKSIVFNHDNIEQVFFEGYLDEESKKFGVALKEVGAKLEAAKKQKEADTINVE